MHIKLFTPNIVQSKVTMESIWDLLEQMCRGMRGKWALMISLGWSSRIGSQLILIKSTKTLRK